jgi:hypothetical protein
MIFIEVENEDKIEDDYEYEEEEEENEEEEKEGQEGEEENNSDTSLCAICQFCFHFGENVVMTNCTPCRHHFHEDCLWNWCKEHNSCPICKVGIVKR